MRTFVASAKRADTKWHVIDASGKVLGRVATVTVRLLQGKHKASYTPFIDTGDHVVIINAAKVKVTGTKETAKKYHRPRTKQRRFPGLANQSDSTLSAEPSPTGSAMRLAE